MIHFVIFYKNKGSYNYCLPKFFLLTKVSILAVLYTFFNILVYARTIHRINNLIARSKRVESKKRYS